MKKVAENTTITDRKIIIHTRKYLDCRAHRTFIQACQLAEKQDVRAIVVDFKATHGIRDSGLGMLLMLNLEAETLEVPVLLENCSPKIKTQLSSSRLLANLYAT